MKHACPTRWWIEEYYIRQNKSIEWCGAQFGIPGHAFNFFARKLGLTKQKKKKELQKKKVIKTKKPTVIHVKKKTYGETIVERLSGLDFRLTIDSMMHGLYASLPKRMKKEDAMIYYTQKLKRYWENTNG